MSGGVGDRGGADGRGEWQAGQCASLRVGGY
jgi:hypothetical protein